jgi:methylase of polypeptide subunit release factors
MTDYLTVRYGNLDVYYHAELDGGGQLFGQDYLRIVTRLPVRPRTVFEWCAGPAFIGFSILAHGLCERLCLADFNSEAVAACRRTIQANNLFDRVTVYQSDGLDSIPDRERWDLVVGNPPHSGTDKEFPWGPKHIYMDVGWKIHRRFWASIRKFLNPQGIVLIQENSNLSMVSDFAQMIEGNAMRICYVAYLPPPHSTIYYIGVSRSEDAAELRGLGFGL